MKEILFISPDSNPFSGKGWGAVQRTNLLFEAVSRLGNVDIISFQDGVESDRDNCHVLYSQSDQIWRASKNRIWLLLKTLFPITPYSLFPKNHFRANVVKSFVKKKDYDIIICRYFPSAMQCGLIDYPKKLVVDIDDAPSDVELIAAKTARSWRNRVYHYCRWRALGRCFKRLQSKCHITFYSNPEQAIYGNSVYLPNIPFYEDEIPAADFENTAPRIIFVGNLNFGPNIQGVDRFIDYVYPLVQNMIPNVEFHIVGKCSFNSFIDKWEHVEGVTYMGFVDDLKKEYSEARVVVVPIYEGAGTNIKILEAMKMKRPCVTTECGYRGFTGVIAPNVCLSVSRNDDEFAKHVVELLINKEQNHMVSERAHSVISDHFSRRRFFCVVERALND